MNKNPFVFVPEYRLNLLTQLRVSSPFLGIYFVKFIWSKSGTQWRKKIENCDSQKKNKVFFRNSKTFLNSELEA